MSPKSFPKQYLLTTCLSSFLLFTTLHGDSLSSEKVLQVKRISEYWKDRDYKRAKKHILDFLQTSVASPVHDQLCAMLGDLYFLDNDYTRAIESYMRVQDPEVRLKISRNLLQSHFLQKNYAGVFNYVQTAPEVVTSPECRLLYAESLLQDLLTNNEQTNVQKRDLIKQNYQALTSSPFQERALRVLAFLHQISEEYPQAVSMYNSLMVIQPQEEENLRMEIACLQIHYDLEAAIQSFETIYEQNGPLTAKAAYNQMILLFDSGDMNRFLEKKASFGPKLSQEHANLLHFLLARGYYSTKNYPQALEEFQNYFNSSNRKKNHDHVALITALDCAKELHYLELFEQIAAEFNKQFPNAVETENLLLVYTQLCLDVGSFAKTQTCLEQIKTTFPENRFLESLWLQYSLSLVQNNLWDDGYIALANFLASFPTSKHQTFVLQQQVECSFQKLQNLPEDQKEPVQRVLLNDLSALLKKDLDASKRQNYSFYLSKNLFSLREYTQAKRELSEYINAYPDSSNFSQALFLSALCDLHSNEPGQFIISAEKALANSDDRMQKEFLYLELYNTYLYLHEVNKAADVLYTCYEMNPSAIRLENLCWLAQHYEESARRTLKEEDIQRATKIFNSLVPFLSQENSHLEGEVLRFAQLLDLQKKYDEKLALLQNLYSMQSADATNWKQQHQTVLELARTYEKLGNRDQATILYDQLSASGSLYHSSVALLEKSALTLKSMPSQELISDNDQVSEILDNLKDLQIKKYLATEPVHLEASLAYAELRIALAPQEIKQTEALFYYNRILEDFQNEEYLKNKEQFPEQLAIYQAYVKYIELKIDGIKANIARQENLLEEVANLETSAHSKLSSLTEQKLPSYLEERVRQTQ